MKQSITIIRSNQRIADNIYEMKLERPQGEPLETIKPGQFLNLKLHGKYLRRPISICDWNDGEITIVYKPVGAGTKQMSAKKAGETMDLLWPLGNGFDPERNTQTSTEQRIMKIDRPVLIGGGVGVPPMYGLCKSLMEVGQEPVVILGFKKAAEVFYKEKFENFGITVRLATEDGSAGEKGFVTDVLRDVLKEDAPWKLYACGPEAMLRAIDAAAPESIPGQFSFEERMGCGFGACMGCSCKTKYGSKRICKDGPVLERSEILWD